MSRHPFAALVLALSCVACATEQEPRYAGTVAGSTGGVISPGQTITSARQPPVFGTPSSIPVPIRVPVGSAPPAFGERVDMDALYGYDGLGRQGMAEADPLKAEFNFERALEVNPFDPIALNNLAVAKAERGQFYEAMALLERAAKLAPDNSAVVANLARLRGYVQSYATAGVEAAPAARGTGALPQAPPALWDSEGATTTVPRVVPTPIAPPAREAYFSDACRRVSNKKGKVDVICEPTR